MHNQTNQNAYTRGNTRLSGINAYQHLADVWGVPLDSLTTEDYKTAAAKAKAFQRFRNGQTVDDALAYILDHDEKQWQKGLTTIAAAHTTTAYLESIYPQVDGALQQRAENMLYNDAALDHVAATLDIDSACDAVTDAANHLGTTLYDPAAAAQADPQQFASYMKNIAKIVALDAVVRSRADRAALYAEVPPMPPMKFSRDGYGRTEKLYTDADRGKHQAAHDYQRHVANTDQTITSLAVGDYAPLTLSVSLDPATLAKRRARLNNAGTTEQI
ncbi:hypothetical protein [Corynebacterium nuruki]|uniref:hypothetical protein n=1 Tax=Corynebacterium nuruki TaxID=1032851 RepID=UPI0039BFF24C